MDTSHFQTRLAETIAWCSLQTLENNPPETEEFRNRKQLARQGIDLCREARLLEQKSNVQSWLLNQLHLRVPQAPNKLRQQGLELMRAGDVTPILPLSNQLRSLELKPHAFVRAQTKRVEIVEQLSEKRAALLKQKTAYPEFVSSDLAEGKLLAYEPDDNVADGASQHQSMGYFDVPDVPPWDTWLCYFDRHLISWVPPLLLDLVERGLAVNVVDCIRWAEGSLLEELVAATSESRQRSKAG